MTLIVDTREKARAIKNILAHFDRNKINHISSKLPFGDYMNLDRPKLYIDRKQNLNELTANVCQQHARFVRELELCRSCDCKMIVLVEHGGGIKSLEDVKKWENPRLKLSPMAVSGERLYKILSAMSKKYGVEFLFCDKRSTGKRIVELLGEHNGKEIF